MTLGVVVGGGGGVGGVGWVGEGVGGGGGGVVGAGGGGVLEVCLFGCIWWWWVVKVGGVVCWFVGWGGGLGSCFGVRLWWVVLLVCFWGVGGLGGVGGLWVSAYRFDVCGRWC